MPDLPGVHARRAASRSWSPTTSAQGKVKVVYRSFCTATCNGPDPSVFNTQQVAGLAAGKQNKFWQYTELFYHEQGRRTRAT